MSETRAKMSNGRLKALSALSSMDRMALLAAWARSFGGPPPPRTRQGLLRLGLAWDVQARQEGGYSPSLRGQLDKLANALERGGSLLGTRRQRLKTGTRLVREWGGEVHTVLVAEDGRFEWQGERYRSLSAIAKRITGAGWSGPRFFGLDRQVETEDSSGADADAARGEGTGGCSDPASTEAANA